MVKKLFSFRAEPELLKALREKADQQGTSVSELMHELLYKALDGTKIAVNDSSKDPEALIKREIERLKAELSQDITALRQDVTTILKKEHHLTNQE